MNTYPIDCGFQQCIQANLHTRNTSDLVVPLFKTSHAQQCVLYRGTKLWNQLLPDVKNKSLNTIKLRIKEQLRNRY